MKNAFPKAARIEPALTDSTSAAPRAQATQSTSRGRDPTRIWTVSSRRWEAPRGRETRPPSRTPPITTPGAGAIARNARTRPAHTTRGARNRPGGRAEKPTAGTLSRNLRRATHMRVRVSKAPFREPHRELSILRLPFSSTFPGRDLLPNVRPSGTWKFSKWTSSPNSTASPGGRRGMVVHSACHSLPCHRHPLLISKYVCNMLDKPSNHLVHAP